MSTMSAINLTSRDLEELEKQRYLAVGPEGVPLSCVAPCAFTVRGLGDYMQAGRGGG